VAGARVGIGVRMRAIAGDIALPAPRRFAMPAAIAIGATISPRPAPAAAAAAAGVLASLWPRLLLAFALARVAGCAVALALVVPPTLLAGASVA